MIGVSFLLSDDLKVMGIIIGWECYDSEGGWNDGGGAEMSLPYSFLI